MKSWLELEQRFRTLVPLLLHYRLDGQWGVAGEHWRLAGGGITSAVHEYEILSALAGRMLERVFSSANDAEQAFLQLQDPAIRWYNLLRVRSPFFGDRSYCQELHENGSSAGFIYMGTVRQPAEAAAVLCLALEVSHPIIESKGKWQWLHENYVKAILIGTVITIIGMGLKHVIG